MKILYFLLHLLVVLLLTALTQIGGLLWLLAFLLAGFWKEKGKKSSLSRTGRTRPDRALQSAVRPKAARPSKTGKAKTAKTGLSAARAGSARINLRLVRGLLIFLPLYALVSAVVLPRAAAYWSKAALPVFGNGSLKPAAWLYPLLNRHYVTVPTKAAMLEVAAQLEQHYPGAELRYLDAGFPLFKAFPLLPHLSHSDGRKLDLAFFYRNPDGTATNDKPSRSGYGVFEGPVGSEEAMADECRSKGYWQYSYPQYLTMGSRSSLSFDAERTQKLLQLLLRQPAIEKVFLEPHLKQRMGFAGADKIRFHGCQAVRHDDHIHVQLKQ